MRVEVNGIFLNVAVSGQGRPLMLLHGFTGSEASWQPLVVQLPGVQAVALDLIGHGGSDCPPDASRYSMSRCIQDLAAVLRALEIERSAFLGYSMGARVALHFALAYPAMVSALVVESGSPGFSDPAERAARIHRDEELADRIERDGIEAFVDYWERLPLWASQARLPVEKRAALSAQRLRNSTAGLANSLRGMGAGAQEPVFDRLHELRMPALFLAGELDHRYVRQAREMASVVPDSRVCVLANAGHAAHFEQPRQFVERVTEFLTKHGLREKVEA